jgi:hypothetical protein
MRYLVAILALAWVVLNTLVGYLFVHEALTDKMAHKGFVLQSLPMLGGAVLILFCLPLLWQALRLMLAEPVSRG